MQGGETDWKVLAIDVNDPLAPLVNSKSTRDVQPTCKSELIAKTMTISKNTALA